MPPTTPDGDTAWTRTCPRCGAQPRTHCVTAAGNNTQFHTARRNPDNPRPEGRPTTCTPDKIDAVAANLRLGAPFAVAVRAAGVPPETAYRWLATADSDEPRHAPFRAFRDAVVDARAQGAVVQLARINQSAQRHLKSEDPVTGIDPRTRQPVPVTGPDGQVLQRRVWEQDWRAAAWVLERSFARDFGRREVLEVAAADSASALPAAQGAAAELSGSGIDRIAAGIAAFRARMELEAAAPEEVGDPVLEAEWSEEDE